MQDGFEKYVDLNSALGRVRGSKTLYRKMLDMFLNSKEFDSFEEALAAGDNVKASEVAHAIKGMTGNLSFTLVFEYSAALMQQLREGDANPETLENFRKAYQETREIVTQLSSEMEAGTI